MLGIAIKFGIQLEQLLAANPGVDPRLLSVGTVLTIPLGEGSPPEMATPTPLAVRTSGPTCYLTSDQGVWCFLLVVNNLDEPLENVAAKVYLVPDRGEGLLEGIAIPPLNLVPVDSSIPAMVYFKPPVTQGFTPGAQLISAMPAGDIEQRYLPVRVKAGQIEIDPAGLIADVEGFISIPRRNEPAGLVWLAVVAYGPDDQIVGVRKVEIPGPIDPKIDLPYSLQVFSLGPPIARVEVFGEARPLPGSETGTPTGD